MGFFLSFSNGLFCGLVAMSPAKSHLANQELRAVVDEMQKDGLQVGVGVRGATEAVAIGTRIRVSSGCLCVRVACCFFCKYIGEFPIIRTAAARVNGDLTFHYQFFSRNPDSDSDSQLSRTNMVQSLYFKFGVQPFGWLMPDCRSAFMC